MEIARRHPAEDSRAGSAVPVLDCARLARASLSRQLADSYLLLTLFPGDNDYEEALALPTKVRFQNR